MTENEQEMKPAVLPVEETPLVEKPEPVNAVEWEIIKDVKDDYDPAKDRVNCFLPDGTQKQILDQLAANQGESRYADTERSALYRQMLQHGFERGTRRGLMYNELNDPAKAGERQWRQVLKEESGVVGALAPKFKESTTKVTGERALIRVRALTGKGGQMSFPLPHTGIWVTMVSPTEIEILNLWSSISQDRVTLGRIIFGASLANESVYTAKRIVDFAIRHIVDTNYAEGVEGIVDVLSSHDIQHLAWACACMMYQNGFLFARSIITDDVDESLIQHGRINVTKLQFIDRLGLTEKQRGFLARRTEKKSKVALEEYQKEMKRGVSKIVKLSDTVEVELRVPTYTEYIDAGFSWIEGLDSLIRANFKVEEGDDEYNSEIEKTQRATLLRQYDHWVKSIRVLNEAIGDVDPWEVYERDEDGTVEMLLDFLTSNDEVRVAFFKAVKEYQEASCIAQICVPAASPKEVEDSKETPYPYLVPIDSVAVFISLLISTVGGVMARSEQTFSM